MCSEPCRASKVFWIPAARLRTDLVNHADPTDATSTAYHPKIGAQFATPKDQQTKQG